MRAYNPENYEQSRESRHQTDANVEARSLSTGQNLTRTRSQSAIAVPKVTGPKRIVLQPGTPCDVPEEILTTTKTTENGVTTYLITKALTGIMLQFASQPTPLPVSASRKQLPETPQPLNSNLQPHLPSYSAVTHEGTYRPHNEDKIAIVLEDNVKWFGVYDGHGGDKCSQYLKEHLHKTFFNIKKWQEDVRQALKDAFVSVERQWIKQGDGSGSCCIVTLIVDDTCYVANLGDSRAILASEGLRKVYQISKDHKPSNMGEQERVISAGGKIYQTTAISELGGKLQQFIGPLRVYPGRLSTTRSFGDFEAKDPKTGGNPNVVISEPQITSFNISDHDFIVMASDGLWDRIDNKQALKIVRQGAIDNITPVDFTKRGADILLRDAMFRGSTDNISVVVIGLPKLTQTLGPVGKLEESGTEHIKVLSAISSPDKQMKRKKKDPTTEHNKENENNPSKIKAIDSRISQITKSAEKLVMQR